MRVKKDYYAILGITKTATKSEIKDSYRFLAMQFHPDKHEGNKNAKIAEQKFKELTEAYETLIDDEKRAAYDDSINDESEVKNTYRTRNTRPKNNSTATKTQSWRVDFGYPDIDHEFTLVSQNKFERLLRIKETKYSYAVFNFYDEIELWDGTKVISGHKPELQGCYYLLNKGIPRNEFARRQQVGLDLTSLFIGNSEIGNIMMISFVNDAIGSQWPGAVRIGSREYARQFNEHFNFVNGDEEVSDAPPTVQPLYTQSKSNYASLIGLIMVALIVLGVIFSC